MAILIEIEITRNEMKIRGDESSCDLLRQTAPERVMK